MIAAALPRQDPFAWCPETVRHIFAAHGFGLCPHGARLRRLDNIVWTMSCGDACQGGDDAAGSVLFALGHHREVPGRVEPWNDERGFRAFLASAVPTTRERVICAVPRDQVFLAEDLGVYEWSAAPFGDAWGAIGHMLGLPVCAIAPLVGHDQALAPEGGRWVVYGPGAAS